MSNDSDVTSLSLFSLLSEQSRLLKQAAKAIPHSFNQCTYDQPGGYIRQAVYLCKTCAGGDGKPGKGICAACSVSCHADHEQLELFPKRAFRCDCPTSSIPVPCTLHRAVTDGEKEPPNEDNQYGQNYSGRFCRCGRDYDPLTEMETMVQCLACEDWWHESCLNIIGTPVNTARTPKSSPTKGTMAMRSSSPVPVPSSEPSSEADYNTEDEEDGEEEDSPTSLMPASAYDTLICGSCVAAMPVLRRWAGTKGVQMVIRKGNRIGSGVVLRSPSKGVDFGGWEVLGEAVEDGEDPFVSNDRQGAADEASASTEPVKKRSSSPAADPTVEPPPKKIRLEGGLASPSTESSCRAPVPNDLAQKVLRRLDRKIRQGREVTEGTLVVDEEQDEVEGAGDLFLSEGWRERLCRCKECLSQLQAYPYLLEEEETYTPPDDPDSKKSLEELGLRALGSLPRDKALDSIRAFNEMRDDLLAYLRPFAQEGKVVSEQDVTAFFEALKEGKRKVEGVADAS